MRDEDPFGGGVLIADTSVWQRAAHPKVRERWAAAIRSGRIATCSIVKLELVYSAIDGAGFLAVEQDQSALRDIPVTVSAQHAAIGALRALAARGPLHHRVPLPDVLIAAAAQEAGVGVLHYDRHYDRLAEVLDFDNRWVARAGSL